MGVVGAQLSYLHSTMGWLLCAEIPAVPPPKNICVFCVHRRPPCFPICVHLWLFSSRIDRSLDPLRGRRRSRRWLAERMSARTPAALSISPRLGRQEDGTREARDSHPRLETPCDSPSAPSPSPPASPQPW